MLVARRGPFRCARSSRISPRHPHRGAGRPCRPDATADGVDRPGRMRALCPLRRKRSTSVVGARSRRPGARSPAVSTGWRCRTALPAGAARNAIDCALVGSGGQAAPACRCWELRRPASAAAADHRLHPVAGRARRRWRAQAAENAHRPLLKIKLGGDGGPRPACGRPRRRPGRAPHRRCQRGAGRRTVCADLAPQLARPGRRADRAAAARRRRRRRWPRSPRPIPLCADESCHDRADAGRRSPAATTWSTSSSTRPAG